MKTKTLNKELVTREFGNGYIELRTYEEYKGGKEETIGFTYHEGTEKYFLTDTMLSNIFKQLCTKGNCSEYNKTVPLRTADKILLDNVLEGL